MLLNNKNIPIQNLRECESSLGLKKYEYFTIEGIAIVNRDVAVLIVEDSPTQALSLQYTLEKHDYRVEVARDGIDGLKRLEESFFPVIITDWVMPEMDGIEFCKEVRSRELKGYTYIIILTANDSRDDIIAGLQAGADDYLVKPVHDAELIARLFNAKRVLSLEFSLKKRNEEIALLSVTDPLTTAFNRRYLNEHLPDTLKLSSRYGRPVSLIICDIDHFKNVNDIYGHQIGDKVLAEFSRCLLSHVREGLDWVVRFGGEEFCILLPETDQTGAMAAAERYRQATERMEISTEQGVVSITASFGSATFEPPEGARCISAEDFIGAADACLYEAKEAGRNRCIGTLCGQTDREGIADVPVAIGSGCGDVDHLDS